ncbi:hypothetical protein SpCBS45565_g01944 [Spizellomyces sp. 'palustris']|nr:hypothetical protein SpCBS45565_g01944 [Spizellomyces sp. 'palustris']
MAGHHHPKPPGLGFTAPRVRGVWATKLMMAPVWFFVYYRMYHDGPHHFVSNKLKLREVMGSWERQWTYLLHKHSWEEPKNIAYLEEVDKKYGTNYATANMHHH